MADIRINALAGTATSSASDDYLAIDGAANGTRKLSAYSPTFGGNLTVSGTQQSFGAANSTNYILTPGTNTATGVQHIQGGAGSGTYGGSLSLFQGSHATKAGFVSVGLGSSDGSRKFTVNNLGLASGTDVFTVDISGNTVASGNLTVSGTSATLNNSLIAASGSGFDVKNASSSAALTSIYGGSAYNNGAGITLAGTTHATQADTIVFTTGAYVERARLNSSGNLLIGTTTDSSNGKLQLATHTTSAGGIGFGTDTSFFRSAAGNLQLSASVTSAAIAINNVGSGVAALAYDATGALVYSTGSLRFQTNSGTTALTLDSSQNATFAKKVAFTAQASGTTLVDLSSTDDAKILGYGGGNTFVKMGGNLNLSSAGYTFISTAGSTALTLDSSQNATFAGSVKVNSANGIDINSGGTTAIFSQSVSGVRKNYLYFDGTNTTLGTDTGNINLSPAGTKVVILSGKALQLGNAYTASVIVPTGYVTIQDSTGTTYKVAVSL